MNDADAGVVGVLSPAEVAKLATVKTTARKPARLAPEPIADDTRPLETLEAEATTARERLDALREQRLTLASKAEAIERDIEAARETLDVSATTGLRAQRSAMTGELAELSELERRASTASDAASRASSRARTRIQAAALAAALSDLIATGPDSDAEGIAAVSGLLDWEERRFALIEQANKLKAQLTEIPADLRGAIPNANPLQLTVDRLMALRQPARRRRLSLGL
jgi:chromosome segregation ATPase